jgi:hypothetical protein
MDVVQVSLIFHYRLKGYGYNRIHRKLVARSGQNADAEDSVKYWVREDDGGRRDTTELSRLGKRPSDIVDAASTILSQKSFSPT